MVVEPTVRPQRPEALLRQVKETQAAVTAALRQAHTPLVLAAVLAARAETQLLQAKAAPEEQDCRRPLLDLVLLGVVAAVEACTGRARQEALHLRVVGQVAVATLAPQVRLTRAAAVEALATASTAAQAVKASSSFVTRFRDSLWLTLHRLTRTAPSCKSLA